MPPGEQQTDTHRPTIPLVTALEPFIKHWTDGDYLVSWRGRQVRKILKSFTKIRNHVGLPDVIPYTIRHTMASKMRRASVPWPEIAGWLRHSIGNTTDVYAHWPPDYLASGARAIDAYWHEIGDVGRVLLEKRQ